MDWKDYKDAVLSDAKDVIEESYEDYDSWEELFDELHIDDSVTGNGSGSYTFSTAQAKKNVAELIWDDDAIQAFNDVGYAGIPTDEGPEAVDVIARCLALYEVADELEDYFDELKEEEESEEDDD